MGQVVARLYTAPGYFVALALAFAMVLLPLSVTQVPPIEDYPNHLARMWILAHGQHDPYLSQMYAPDWHLIPNLAIDIMVPPLLSVLPLYVAGRIMLAIALLLPVLGTIALNAALHRRRSLWPLASCLIAYNFAFLIGFINFLIGLGVALLTAAGWMTLRVTRPVLAQAALVAGAVAVFFCHIVPVALLGILVACTQLECLLARWRRGEPMLRPLVSNGREFLVGFISPVILYKLSPFGTAQGGTEYSSAKLKLMELVSPVLNYHLAFDLVTAAIISLSFFMLLLRRSESERRLPLRIGLSIAALVVGGPCGTSSSRCSRAPSPH